MNTKPVTFKCDDKGHATLGGVSLDQLVSEYKTPLYVIDYETLRQRCTQYVGTLEQVYPNSKVLYAGKANISVGVIQIMKELGMCLDVSSGGELFTAIKAGMPANKIYFHGNNKTLAELELALDYGVSIVVDNEQELTNIISLKKEGAPSIPLLIRLKPEIDAHTHDYIRTGQLDSKFGIQRAECDALIATMLKEPGLEFRGIHSHIGSQIFDTKPYLELLDILVPFMKHIKQEHGVDVKELNCGGGMGIYYSKQDAPMDIESFITLFTKRLGEVCEQFDVALPILLFEPGRSIVGPAGVTLYSIGAIKEIQDLKTYLFIDGGMADNPRPMLYQSQYEFDVLPYRSSERKAYSIAGKFCESGDILAENVELPVATVGDVLIVFNTGAYNYSMASHYNRNVKPATAIVRDGEAHLLVQRETYDDLVRFDCAWNG